MTAYRKAGGSVTRTSIRVHRSGTAKGTGTRPRTPVFPTGSTTYAAEPLGAGGWVTGLAISPDGLTRLGRTDTMGAWRWDSGADKWVSSTSATTMPSSTPAAGSRRMFPYNALDSGEGVFGLAVANDIAYMAYRDAIFTSTNRGVSWSVSLTGGPKTSANISSIKRWTSHMAVDPNSSAVCIYGTVNAGLWYTLDSGATWTQVPSTSLPFGPDGATVPGNNTFGIPAVMIDTAGTWYASPFGLGLYTSTDHGSTWTKISSDSQIACIVDLQYGPNGDVMVAGWLSSGSRNDAGARVYRYRSGTWAQMAMPGTAKNWNTIAYDPRVPGRVMVQGSDGGAERISLDYGATWNAAFQTFASASSDVPWLAASNGGAATNFFVTTGGLQFDPQITNRVWMSQGIGVWYADLPTDPTAVIPWHAQSRGIEQLVVNDVMAPPGGRAVVSSWDRPIFVVGETTGGGTYPYQYHPDDGTLSSGWHADYSSDDPTWLAASVWDRAGFSPAHPGYSADSGVTWTTFATIPTNSGAFFAGSVHVGAPGHIIWVSAGGKGAAYTTDSGTTWTAVAIPGATMSLLNNQTYFIYRRPIASEKTAGSANTFYAFVTGTGFYKSTDTGATWTQQCNNTQFSGYDWSQMAYLKTVPNQPGHLFLTPGWEGAGAGTETTTLPFKRSTDGGVTWTTVPSITSVRGFDFGAAGPGYAYPAIYAIGWVGGIKGVYRSTDNALTWTLLSTQPNGTVDFIRNVAASKDTFGKHWITTAGSGLIVGQIT